MKITAFDDLYPLRPSVGGAVVYVASGSNSGEGDTGGGGDVTGTAGDYTVVGLRQTVSLASNIGGGTVGDVLTIVQTSPRLAMFATPSNTGVSFGSNASRVSEVASVGALSTAAREDHIHDGVGTITASSSNTLQRGTVNLRPGTNVSFGLTDGDGDGEFDTLTINSTAAPGAGGGDTVGQFVVGFDGGGAAITAGAQQDVVAPFTGTITGWTILADQSGSAVIDIWNDTYGNYPPTDADTITASATPTLSAATKAASTTLTGWDTAVTAGDVLRFNLDSASTVERLLLVVDYSRP